MGNKVGMVVAAAVAVCAATAGGAWWWVQQQVPRTVETVASAKGPTIDMNQASYVTLDKIVVMLRAPAAQRGYNAYLAADLVLRTDKVHEKAVKAELPMLKGVAAHALSRMDVEQARGMSMEEWSAMLQRELMAAYDEHPHLRLFDRVMVSRLIIE